MIVVGVAVMGMCSATVARANDLVVAKVPFPFLVNGDRLPAGKYVVSNAGSDGTGVLTVGSADGHRVALTITTPASEPPAGSSWTPKLIFDKVDGVYFLADVDYGRESGRQVPLTDAGMVREALAVQHTSGEPGAGSMR